jgi:glycosyltransferase involved in cell wall biosynthesis
MNNKKKIVIWLGPDNRSKGGVASVIDTFVSNQYFEKGRRVFIHTVSDTSSAGKLKSLFVAMGKYLRLLPQAGLVHIHVSSDASFYRKYLFSFLARMYGVKYLIHLHSSSFPGFYSGAGFFGKYLIRNFYKNAASILVLSNEMKEFVKQLERGLETEIFPNPICIMESPEQVERDKTFLFMGRIFSGKGLEELFSAFQKLQVEYPEWKLLIGGTGDASYEASLKTRFAAIANCCWLGWVSGKKKQDLYNVAGVFVLPSYGEGQSIAILEAMAAGIPVLTTEVGGNSFLIENDKSGILVAPKDSHAFYLGMKRLAEDAALRESLAKEARSRVERVFDYKHVKQQLEILYKDLLQ